jgi:hypothetical protein
VDAERSGALASNADLPTRPDPASSVTAWATIEAEEVEEQSPILSARVSANAWQSPLGWT